jgi:hypothetical protein
VALGVQEVYNFNEKQASLLEVLQAIRRSTIIQPPASVTRQLLIDTYDSLLKHLALDVGNCIVKPELQKDIT